MSFGCDKFISPLLSEAVQLYPDSCWWRKWIYTCVLLISHCSQLSDCFLQQFKQSFDHCWKNPGLTSFVTCRTCDFFPSSSRKLSTALSRRHSAATLRGKTSESRALTAMMQSVYGSVGFGNGVKLSSWKQTANTCNSVSNGAIVTSTPPQRPRVGSGVL